MATIPTLNPNCLKNDDELEKYASELGIDLINLNTDSARARYITKIKELYNTLNNNKIPELKNCISNTYTPSGLSPGIIVLIVFGVIASSIFDTSIVKVSLFTSTKTGFKFRRATTSTVAI